MESDSLCSPPAGTSSSGSADVTTTLYFGNLHKQVTHQGLEDLCTYFGAVESVKVIKDKLRGTSAGYGFVRFATKDTAEQALQALNGKEYLGLELRVNWALPNHHKEDTSTHFHIFVGDLGSEVTDAALFAAFAELGVQCSDARVMWDQSTGRSKGYGFVSFRKKEEAEAAKEQMQGKLVGSRRIRVGWAQHKQDDSCAAPDLAIVDRADPCNSNVYVGNIAPETTEADLIDHFSQHGAVTDVKLHKKGGYGFVEFKEHEAAVKAIVAQHRQKLHGRTLKCSWGKNNVKKAGPPNMGALLASLQGLSTDSISPLLMPQLAGNSQQGYAALQQYAAPPQYAAASQYASTMGALTMGQHAMASFGLLPNGQPLQGYPYASMLPPPLQQQSNPMTGADPQLLMQQLLLMQQEMQAQADMDYASSMAAYSALNQAPANPNWLSNLP